MYPVHPRTKCRSKSQPLLKLKRVISIPNHLNIPCCWNLLQNDVPPTWSTKWKISNQSKHTTPISEPCSWCHFSPLPCFRTVLPFRIYHGPHPPAALLKRTASLKNALKRQPYVSIIILMASKSVHGIFSPCSGLRGLTGVFFASKGSETVPAVERSSSRSGSQKKVSCCLWAPWTILIRLIIFFHILRMVRASKGSCSSSSMVSSYRVNAPSTSQTFW